MSDETSTLEWQVTVIFLYSHLERWERAWREGTERGESERREEESQRRKKRERRDKIKEGRERRETGDFKHYCSFLFQWCPGLVDKCRHMTLFITIVISSSYLQRQSFLGLEHSTCNFEGTQISPYHWTGKCHLKSSKSTFKLINVK